ncbi:MAG: 2-amino-4-hydroxy-6-hydroxymethyldihydropteridine diphosphokinase [Bdellovibrionota bacterium]
MPSCFIALGSNLGDRRRSIHSALSRIAALPGTKLLRTSSFYASEPWGMPPGTPGFLNACAAIETVLSPSALLSELQRIERLLGKVKRRGASGEYLDRPIDLDVLAYGEIVVNEPGLRIPHPEMEKRRFVLAPLAQIAGNFRHPVSGKTLAALLDECPDKTRAWKAP